jgi:hypothetical protein
MLSNDYITSVAAAAHSVGALFVLDCIASGELELTFFFLLFFIFKFYFLSVPELLFRRFNSSSSFCFNFLLSSFSSWALPKVELAPIYHKLGMFLANNPPLRIQAPSGLTWLQLALTF